jgi:hypothetical protein
MNADTACVLWKCLPTKKLAFNLNLVHLGINQVSYYVVSLLTVHLKLSFSNQ